MVLRFIRRDPAWKYMPTFAVTLALAAMFYNPRHRSSLLGAMIAPVFVILFMRAVPHRRVTLFEAALPVSGPDLFLARLLALLSLVWVPAAAMGAVLALRGYGGTTAAELVVIALVVTLAVLGSLSVRIREFAAPSWLTALCPLAATAVLVPALLLERPLLMACALAAAIAVWGTVTWKAVPEAFQSPVSRRRESAGNAAPAMPWWPVMASLSSWQTLMFVAVSVFFVASGSWIYAPLYMMFAYNQMRMCSRWTLALPISCHTMLAVSVLPLLLVLGVGTEVGILAGMARETKGLVRLGDAAHFRATGALDVSVDRAFWRMARRGQVPVIRAPWGETTLPPAHRFLGLTFYNPYAVGEKNSLHFQDWQFLRATTDIYGRPFAARELAKAKTLPVPATLQPRMQVLTIAAILAIALFWVWVVEVGAWYRVMRLSSLWRPVMTTALVVPLLAFVGVEMFIDKGPGSLGLAVLQWELLWVSRHLPENLAAVILASLAALAAMWWIVDRQAAAAEINPSAQAGQTMFDRCR